LKFHVQIVGASNTLAGHSLSLTGISFGGSGGIAYISDELRNGHGTDLAPAVVIADNEADVFQFENAAACSPQTELSVTTNIFIAGISNADAINVSTFSLRFSQTGSPVLLGDYNQDGTVDAADCTLWRKYVGTS